MIGGQLALSWGQEGFGGGEKQLRRELRGR